MLQLQVLLQTWERFTEFGKAGLYPLTTFCTTFNTANNSTQPAA